MVHIRRTESTPRAGEPEADPTAPAASPESATPARSVRRAAGVDPRAMVEARKAAKNLGKFLAERGRTFYREAGMKTEAMNFDRLSRPRIARAMEKAFGPRLPETGRQGGKTVFGRKFIYDETTGWETKMADGGSLARLPYLKGTFFFYQPMLLDLKTGSVYQAMNPAGTGADAAAGGTGVFGPMVPPANARLQGNFSKEQLAELYQVVVRAMQA